MKNFILNNFTIKHYLIISAIVISVYGMEATINVNLKRDCKEMCSLDKKGPDYKFLPVSLLPKFSGRSSIPTPYRSNSSCDCFSKEEVKKQKELRDTLHGELL